MLKKFVLPVLLSGFLVLSLPVSALAAPNTSSLDVPVPIATSDSQQCSVSVSGTDFLDLSAEDVEIACVRNLGSGTLYVDVLVDDMIIEEDLLYSYDEPTDTIGIMSLSSTGFDIEKMSGRVSAHIYDEPSSADNRTCLYDGTLYGVYADVESDGNIASSLIGTRFCANADANLFRAPRTIYVGDVYAALESSSVEVSPAFDGTAYHIPYIAAGKQSVHGLIEYVDENNRVIFTEEVVNIGDGTFVDVAPSIETDGIVYVPATYSSRIYLSCDNPRRTVRCLAASSPETPFSIISVMYVGEDGTPLMHERVRVNDTALLYTPPKVFSQSRNGQVDTWSLVAVRENGDTKELSSTADFSLSLSSSSPTQVYLVYRADNASVSYRVGISVVSTTDTGSQVSRIENMEFSVKADAPAQVSLPEIYECDGKVYRAVGDISPYTYSMEDYLEGVAPRKTVYYAEEGALAKAKPYDIAVRGVDIATGRTIVEKTMTSTIDTACLAALADSVSNDGIEYVKLAGQADIEHNYYDPSREYVVYYRPADAPEYKDAAVSNTSILETPTALSYNIDDNGQVLTLPNGIQGTETVSSVSVSGVGDNTPSSNTTEAVTPDGGTYIEDQIEDNPVPLAEAPSAEPVEVVVAENEAQGMFWGVGAAIAAAILIIALVATYRRKNAEEQ